MIRNTNVLGHSLGFFWLRFYFIIWFWFFMHTIRIIRYLQLITSFSHKVKAKSHFKYETKIIIAYTYYQVLSFFV